MSQDTSNQPAENRPVNERDDSALVPSPPGPVEKTLPGAKRILSGMVADTLALVKKELPARPTLRIGMCGFELWPEYRSEFVPLLLQVTLGKEWNVEFRYFTWTNELINAAQQSRFDLFILLLNPGIYASKISVAPPVPREPNWDDHGDEISAYEFIASLKRDFDKPILVINNEIKYKSNDELEKLKRAGAADVLYICFGLDEFRLAVQKCLTSSPVNNVGPPLGENAPQVAKERTLRIVAVSDNEGLLQSIEVILLGLQGITYLQFQDSREAWQELLRADPDLFLTSVRIPGLSGVEILERLLDRRATFPIIVLSWWTERDERYVQEYAQRGLNVTMLSVPFVVSDFRKRLDAALKSPRATFEKASAIVPQTSKTRPPRIVIVNDEEGPLQSMRVVLRDFKGVTLLLYQKFDEAWQELSREAPGLLIMGARGIGWKGQEIARRLLEQQAAFPIIVTSAYEPEKQWVWEYARLGLNITFLPLPFDISDLRTRVEKALKIPSGTIAKSGQVSQSFQIFVVDDEDWLLEIVEQMLASQGYKIRAFQRPEIAMQEFISENSKPDLIITGLNMGRLSGFDVIEQVRRIASKQKILMMSGMAYAESVNRAHKLGVPFLAKPFTQEQLIDAVRSLLEGASAPHE